jgi:1,4-alpha-glucan branching enzyme
VVGGALARLAHPLENRAHSGIQSLVRDLNRAYCDTPALWERDYDQMAFWWLEPDDAENSVFAFARIGKDASKPVVFVGQSHAGAPPRPPPRPAGAGPLDGARQHRLLALRRVGHRQPRRRGDRGRAWMNQYHSAELSPPPLAALWLVPEDG